MSLAFISNPLSRKNRRRADHFSVSAQNLLSDRYHAPSTLAELRQIALRLSENDVRTVVISGGDGTISDIMTTLVDVYGEKNLPQLAIFPSGNSNLIARDVGFRARSVNALKQLLQAPDSLKRQMRGTLRVTWHDEGVQQRVGMFHGTTGFTRAIDIAHSPRLLHYAPHNLAVAATLLATLWKLLQKRYRHAWLQGDHLKLVVDGKTATDDDSFLFIATSLECLTMGMWPFWQSTSEGAHRDLRFLNVAAYPGNLCKAVRLLMRGKSPPWLRAHPSYLSDEARELDLTCASDFVLDGEKFSPGPSRTTRISSGPKFCFVHD